MHRLNDKYRSLIGKQVEYINNDGKTKFGELLRFEINKRNPDIMMACIKKRWWHWALDIIPLYNIHENNFKPQPSYGRSSHETKSDIEYNEITGILKYYDAVYTVTDHPKFKVGDHVMWKETNLIGEIQLVLKRQNDFFTVTQFDETTKHLPQYLPSKGSPQMNRNIVPISKLVSLKEACSLQQRPTLYSPSVNSSSRENEAYQPSGSSNTNGHAYRNESNLISFSDDTSTSDERFVTTYMQSYANATKFSTTSQKVNQVQPNGINGHSLEEFPVLHSTQDQYQKPPSSREAEPTKAKSQALELSKIKKEEAPPQETFERHRAPALQNHFQSHIPSQPPDTGWMPSEPTTFSPKESFHERRKTINEVSRTETNSKNFKESSDEPEEELQPSSIDPSLLRVTFEDSNYVADRCKARMFGIQGNENSCYMDSSIFALFAFNNALNSVIVAKAEGGNTAAEIIFKKIILQWWKYYFVSWEIMKLLREHFAKEFNKAFKTSYMDAEEFLLTLFETLEISQLFQYDYGGEELIHQIMLPEASPKLKGFIPLNSLLLKSFQTSDVLLSRKPSVFIVKLPVSEGVLIPCDGVVPNLTLDLNEILKEKKEDSFLHLSAIIFLRREHFVVVARTGIDTDAPWVFLDSKPTTSLPEMVFMDDLGQWLTDAEKVLGAGNEQMMEMETVDEVKDHSLPSGYKLFRDAYICIYTDETGFKK